jgi:predicted nuclease of predicted toxin-antitoxin system
VKVLLDSCVAGGVAPALAAAGHDVISAGDWPSDPGDEEILAAAQAQNRVLVTLDKDFGELAIARGRPHCGIIRLVNLRARQQAALCAQVLETHSKDLAKRRIITVQTGRLRVRTE